MQRSYDHNNHPSTTTRTLWRVVGLFCLMALSAACEPIATPAAPADLSPVPTVALFTAAPTVTPTPTIPTVTPLAGRISPADLALTATAAAAPGDSSSTETEADSAAFIDAARRAVGQRLDVASESVEIVLVEAAAWTEDQLACRDSEASSEADSESTPTLTPTPTPTSTNSPVTVTPLPTTSAATSPPRTVTATRTATATATRTATITRTPPPSRTPSPTPTSVPLAGARLLALVSDRVYEVRAVDGQAVICVETSLYDDHADLFLSRDPAAAELAAVAKERLGRDLDLPEASMVVVSARPVKWEDTSLGCPDPGQTYERVAVDGYQIVLEVGEARYSFHTDADRVIRCDGE